MRISDLESADSIHRRDMTDDPEYAVQYVLQALREQFRRDHGLRRDKSVLSLLRELRQSGFDAGFQTGKGAPR